MSDIVFNMIPRSLYADKEVNPLSIVVYGALCSFADEEGVCWPSHKTIAKEANVSESTVKRALRQLEKKGFVFSEKRFDSNGSLTSKVYRVNKEKLGRIIDPTPSPKMTPAYVCETQPLGLTEPTLRSDRPINYNHRTITNEQEPKERRAKEKTPAPAPDLSTLSEALRASFEDWMEYKKQKKDKYTSKGLEKLLTQVKNNVAQYGEAAVIHAIDVSIASNWQGIIFDKAKEYKVVEIKPEIKPHVLSRGLNIMEVNDNDEDNTRPFGLKIGSKFR